MGPRRALGLVLAIMCFPMFLTGVMLTIFIGFEYSMTPFIIGLFFVVLGAILMAIPEKARPTPPVPLFAGLPASPAAVARLNLAVGLPPPPPRRVECPSCGASPSQVPPNGVVTCEYCEQTYVV